MDYLIGWKIGLIVLRIFKIVVKIVGIVVIDISDIVVV